MRSRVTRTGRPIGNIDVVITALGDHYTPDEAPIAERMLREFGGTIPAEQLIKEIGLAIAIRRRS